MCSQPVKPSPSTPHLDRTQDVWKIPGASIITLPASLASCGAACLFSLKQEIAFKLFLPLYDRTAGPLITIKEKKKCMTLPLSPRLCKRVLPNPINPSVMPFSPKRSLRSNERNKYQTLGICLFSSLLSERVFSVEENISALWCLPCAREQIVLQLIRDLF